MGNTQVPCRVKLSAFKLLGVGHMEQPHTVGVPWQAAASDTPAGSPGDTADPRSSRLGLQAVFNEGQPGEVRAGEEIVGINGSPSKEMYSPKHSP